MPDKKKAAATEPALNADAVARFRKMSLRMTGEIFRLRGQAQPFLCKMGDRYLASQGLAVISALTQIETLLGEACPKKAVAKGGKGKR